MNSNNNIIMWPLLILFSEFVYFKITLEITFDENVNVLMAFVLAVATSIVLHSMSGIYIRSIEQWEKSNLWGILNTFTRKTFIEITYRQCAIGLIASIIIGRLIVLGFSEDLSYEIGAPLHNGALNGRFLVFSVIMMLPLYLLHVWFFYQIKNTER